MKRDMKALVKAIGQDLRRKIGGFALSEDRLWLVTAPDHEFGLSEYNDEITGVTREYRDEVHYGDHFSYWRKKFEERGWHVTEVEDRT
jgi:hypothetical protein